MNSGSCENRIRGALWGMFVGDALAMPAHWYYDVAALQRDFGVIRHYRRSSGATVRPACRSAAKGNVARARNSSAAAASSGRAK